MNNVMELVDAGFTADAVGIADLSQWAIPVSPSLVTKSGTNAHRDPQIPDKKREQCLSPVLFRESCGHGNTRMIAKPCDRWACPPCAAWRVETELCPEVERAFTWAMETGETLKHVVLTWRGDDAGAQPDKDGANRRRLDIQHLAQYFRRDRGVTFEYLRVAETHRRGTVHVHLLAITPYIQQSVLSAKWSDFARDAFRVTVQAVGLKCPRCWPVDTASMTMGQKRQRIIVPPPGNCTCGNCGYRVERNLYDWSGAIKAVVSEMTKYLTKQMATSGVVKKLNRSRGWSKRCQNLPVETLACEDCDSIHNYHYYGLEKAVSGWATAGVPAPLLNVAYYPDGGGECSCWGTSTQWWPSVCDVTGDILRVGVTVDHDPGGKR